MKKFLTMFTLILAFVGVNTNAEEAKVTDNKQAAEQTTLQWLGTELERIGTALKGIVTFGGQEDAEAIQTEGSAPEGDVETEKAVEVISATTEKVIGSEKEAVKADILKN